MPDKMEGDMLEDEAPVVDEGVADGEETFPAMVGPRWGWGF